MRALRLFVAVLTFVFGGYLLLLANGVVIAMQERAQGWQITPLPVHPVAHVVLYASSAIALQFISAWLLMPQMVGKGTWRFWRRYAATVAFCMGGSLVAAFIVFFPVLALLDAGTP